MIQKAKILKKLQVDGKMLLPGEMVDVSQWRNAKALESNRYIVFVTHVSEEEEKPKKETKSKTAKEAEAE